MKVKVKRVKKRNGAKPTQHHFDIALAIALFFFLCVAAAEVYNAVWVENRPIDVDIADHGFQTFLGVALGMLRGMLPDGTDDGPDDDPEEKHEDTT